METAPLKSFATWARKELITQVSARLSAVLAPGSLERVEKRNAIRTLEGAIAASGGGAAGKDAVADQVAYTWFNRIIALRFMDANGYTGVGIVSPAHGQQAGQPEILAEAKRGSIDPAVVSNKRVIEEITGLLDGTKPSIDGQGEAYTLLLAEYCRYWNRSMPFMFEREGDYTELLIPANLLAADSILSRTVEVLSEEVCQDVEVIGWLYQFYISERKDEVFAGFKKGKKAGADEIPAATQLFTPHWIVRYLVENSVGRLWMLNNPESALIEQMDYYIEPVDEETDFLKIKSPEELTVIDPACGSGHMLTYAFDLLYAIYEEEGYAPTEIPELILTHNLYGTEIDPRAGSLAAFALTMKARAKQRTFFTRLKQAREYAHHEISPDWNMPHIRVIQPFSFTDQELNDLEWDPQDRTRKDLFWNQFRHADVLGSLIEPDVQMTQRLVVELDMLQSHGREDISDEIAEAIQSNVNIAAAWSDKLDVVLPDELPLNPSGTLGEPTYHQESLERADVIARAWKVIGQAQALSRKYAVVVANPPYMGGKQMSTLLSQFMKDEYPDSKSDLFAAFIERCTKLARPRAMVAMITMQSWMFLSSYEKLRMSLLAKQRVTSMLHLGARAFDSIGGEVVSSTAFVLDTVPPQPRETASKRNGAFIRLVDGTSEAEKVSALHSALERRDKEAGFYLASDADFVAIPGSPIVYWLSEKMRSVFTSGNPLGDTASLAVGLQTGDNNRFLRQWWEVSQERSVFACTSREEAAASGARWFPYNKGGEFRKWYGNQEHVVNWENDGAEIRKFGSEDGGRPRSRAQNTDTYFSPSVSWSKISSGAPAFRLYPRGFIYDVAGTSIFAKSAQEQWGLLSYTNSQLAFQQLAAIAPTLNFEVGQVSGLPIADAAEDRGSSLAKEAFSIARLDWNTLETSWDFEGNPLVNIATRT